MIDLAPPGPGTRHVRESQASASRQTALSGLLRLTFLTVMLGALALWPAARASAAGSAAKKPVVTFGIQPATAKGTDSRSYFSFNATDGALIQDHVAVINYSYQPVTLRVHASDAANTAEGDFALLPPNDPAPKFGSWVHLPPSDLTVNVGPRSTVIVPFSVTVPRTADPGDHIGGILATLQSLVTSPSGQRIQLLQSVGTRIFVRVSGPLHPALIVDKLNVTYQGTANPIGDGRAVLTYRIRNTGNVALGGRQTVYVTGLFGSKTYATNVPQVQLLLPGYSVDKRVVLPKFFPELQMHARVLISPLVVPGSVQPPSGPYKGDVTFWAIPWTLVAIVAVVLLGIVSAILLRRRRRNRPPAGAPGGPSGSGPGTGEKVDLPSASEPNGVKPDSVPATAVSGRAPNVGRPVGQDG